MANFNFNKSFIGGRLTADPELKQTTGGTSVTNFSIASNRKFKSEGQPDADFISCVAIGKTAEIICRFLKKGNSIFVEGRLQSRSWTNSDGEKRHVTELFVSEVTFVDGKQNGEQ